MNDGLRFLRHSVVIINNVKRWLHSTSGLLLEEETVPVETSLNHFSCVCARVIPEFHSAVCLFVFHIPR